MFLTATSKNLINKNMDKCTSYNNCIVRGAKSIFFFFLRDCPHGYSKILRQ